MVYLDNASTSFLNDFAKDAMISTFSKDYGNASSLHQLGINSERILTECRENLAKTVNCTAKNVIFTSSGTESNNLAIIPQVLARKNRGNTIVVSLIEHPSVLTPLKHLEKQGFNVRLIMPNSAGEISENDIENAIDDDTIFVSMMYANHEIGSFLPAKAAVKAAQRCKVRPVVHCDCVASFGKTKIDFKDLGADIITISAHKIGGPMGAGAVIFKENFNFNPLMFGGLQEDSLRPGTENVQAIAGFNAAVKALPKPEDAQKHAQTLKDHLLQGLKNAENISINSPESGLPNVINISMQDINAETMLHYLEQHDIFVSSGSACSKGTPSQVLLALGKSKEEALSSIRISTAYSNTLDDIDAFLKNFKNGLQTLSRMKI